MTLQCVTLLPLKDSKKKRERDANKKENRKEDLYDFCIYANKAVHGVNIIL
jgi:hypothetical protein